MFYFFIYLYLYFIIYIFLYDIIKFLYLKKTKRDLPALFVAQAIIEQQSSTGDSKQRGSFSLLPRRM